MNILTVLGYVLALITAVYLLMILLAWYIGHPTPLHWYRPDMHPDDTDTIDGYVYVVCTERTDTGYIFFVRIPELKLSAYGSSEEEAIEDLRAHIRKYYTH